MPFIFKNYYCKCTLALFVLGVFVFYPQSFVFGMKNEVKTAMEDLQIDPHSASASMSYPIVVAQGRGGIQPNLALVYNSQSRDGILGFGWNLETGAIHRSTKEGVPKYDQTDTFVLMQNGSTQELIFDGAEGFYRTKDEGAFLKIEHVNGFWVLTDTKGVKYYFGEYLSHREYHPADQSKVFKWALNKVQDLHGNYMEFDYLFSGNKLYPKEIRYTGHEPTSKDPYAKVVFTYEPREDVQITYMPGLRAKICERLKRVEVYANEHLLNRYELDYVLSPATQRSLLSTIIQFASDNVSSLNAITFSYENNSDVIERYSGAVSIGGYSTEGNNLWNIRLNKDNFLDKNNWELYPRSSTENVGFFTQNGSTGIPVAWGPVSNASSYMGNDYQWNVNAEGSLGTIKFNQDKQFYAWTYFYVEETTTVQFSISGITAVHGIFFDGNYSPSKVITPSHPNMNQTFSPGYHLIEITAYNQDKSGNELIISPALETFADKISSSLPVSPHMTGDFNGDGYIDLAEHDSANGTISVKISNGGGFLDDGFWREDLNSNEKIIVADINRDGLSDLVRFNQATGNWSLNASNGSAFVSQGLLKGGFGAGEQANVADFNGDGHLDLYTFYLNNNLWKSRVAINDGNQIFTQEPQYNLNIASSDKQPITGDFNGDGIADFGQFQKETGDWSVDLGTGLLSKPFDSFDSIDNFGAGRNPVITDFNGDGLTDIGYFDPQLGQVFCRVSSGNKFADEHVLVDVHFTLSDETTSLQAQDFNADGMSDWLAFNQSGQAQISYSQNKIPDLLVGVNNGMGATGKITYKSSAYSSNTFLPFAVPVVSSMTNISELGDFYITKYQYEKGYWDSSEREFRGFGVVKTLDPEGSYSKVSFLQDDVFKGRVLKSEVYDKENRLFSKTENTWGYQTIKDDIRFAYLERTDNFIFDGNDTGRRTAQEYFYEGSPQFGQLTKVVQLGEVDLVTGEDILTDSRTVETAYTHNLQKRLLGVVSQTQVKNHQGDLVRKVSFKYDNLQSSALPTFGLLTEKTHWMGVDLGLVGPKSEYAYDVFGNLLSTRDALSNQTQISYDSQFALFPLMTENAKGHRVESEYYGINGVALESSDGLKGLWGQLKSTTDPNEQQGIRSYDVFGRLEKTIAPLDSVAYVTSESEIVIESDHVRVKNRNRMNHGEVKMIDSVSFIDGLGRKIKSKTPSSIAGTYIISGETEYNSRGLPVKQYLPRFSTLEQTQMDPIDENQAHISIEYDAIGRVVKTTNPDGTYKSVSYDDWSVEAIDENGHKQVSVFDAYGRLIEKREFNGADGRFASLYPDTGGYTLYSSTKYEYDSEGNLIKTIDAHNNETHITYNKLGQKVGMNDPDMGSWSYNYDLNGNLLIQTDAKEQVISFTYDALNRLINKTDGNELNVSYTYDSPATLQSKGRLSKVEYPAGEVYFEYDELGREIASIKAINSNAFSVKKNYENSNQLSSIEYPDGEKLFYQYNDAGMIKGISNFKDN